MPASQEAGWGGGGERMHGMGWPAGVRSRSVGKTETSGQNQRNQDAELPGPERGSEHPGEKDCVWSQSKGPQLRGGQPEASP